MLGLLEMASHRPYVFPGIDPYTHLVDILQRISEHPASRVAELTPRFWKQHFATHARPSSMQKPRRFRSS
jgi:hypothetical protein